MSSFVLKLLAMLLMLLDHIGYAFEAALPHPFYLFLRIVGRTAMPLFCFLIAEGLFHTRNIKSYLLRLMAFAVVSELPFDWFASGSLLNWKTQNVGVTLFLGLLGILLYDSFAARQQKAAALLAIVSAACLAELSGADYGMFGVFYIFIFYYFRGRLRPLTAALGTGVLLYVIAQYAGFPQWEWPLVTLGTMGAVIPIAAYSDNPGGPKNPAARWCLYAFYPAHLLLLCVIKMAV